MKFVLLDSNVICSDFFLRSNASKLLLNEARNERISLLVPRVVLDECLNKYEERAAEAIRQHEKTLSSLDSLGVPIEGSHRIATVSQARRAYTTWLETALKDARATILPYPAVAHEDIVQRILRRRKPSAAKDEGYRDTLIWETLLQFVQTREHDIAFITHNSRDFADQTKGGLATDLVEDLGTRGIKPELVHLFQGLKDFTGEHVPLAQVELIELEKLINSDPDFGGELIEHLYRLLFTNEPIDLPWKDSHFSDPILVEFHISKVDLRDAHQLNEDIILVEIMMQGEATINARVHKSVLDLGSLDEAVATVDRDKWTGYEPEFVHVTLQRRAVATFEASWVPAERQVLDTRLVSVVGVAQTGGPPQRERLF